MFLVSRQAIITAICGIISGGIFSLAAYNNNGGIIALFLPVLPLALPGLAFSSRAGAVSCISACMVVFLLLDLAYALFFLIVLALPLTCFIYRLLLWRGEENAREWYPVLTAIAEVTALTAAIFMLVAIVTVHSEPTDLSTLIWQATHDQVQHSEPNIARFMQVITREWSFLIFASASWVWVLLIYAFVTLANAILNRNSIALRSSLALVQADLPAWVLLVVLLCALLAFAGHGNDAFAGKVVFMVMLLPYFLSGVASVHKICSQWKSCRFWISVFYLTLLLFPWLALLLIARGLYVQVERLLKESRFV